MGNITLLRQDATSLPWEGETFHLVYSYHALEHIPDFQRVLTEMARILVPGGGVVIGTPNRKRLVGYLGSKTGTSWRKKIEYNLNDWKYKLRGRFRNKYGAHAGFTARELETALKTCFSEVTNITLDYYRAIYARRKSLLSALARCRLDAFLFPSVYFVGIKR